MSTADFEEEIEIQSSPKLSETEVDLTTKTDTKTFVQDEVVWGRQYRNLKSAKPKQTVNPKHSPIDVPFQLCRDRQRRGVIRRFNHTASSSRDFDYCTPNNTPSTGYGESQRTKSTKRPSAKSTRSKSRRTRLFSCNESFQKKRRPKTAPPSLLDRSILSQKQYMKMLSYPCTQKRSRKKRKCFRCELEPCSPRILQMSTPLKRLVLENWKMYNRILATERIEHLAQLLQTNQNIEPRLARCYFKQIDRERRRKILQKKQLKRKKLIEKTKGENQWVCKLINCLATAITKYIKREPLFCLNYKQMLLSDTIMETLDEQGILTKPNRTSRNAGDQTLIEVSDKIAVWADTLLNFMDTKDVDSVGDISQLEVPSLLSMLVGEEGEEEEEEEEGEEAEEEEGGRTFYSETTEFGEGEGEEFFEMFGEDLDFLNELSEDILNRLIRILANCSDDFLAQEVDPDRWPGVTYKDILDKLIEIRDGLYATDPSGKPLLEEIMIEWALRNEPDNVDDKILEKINETSRMLQFWLNTLASLHDKWDKDKYEELDLIMEDDYKTVLPALDVIDELEGGDQYRELYDILEDFTAEAGRRIPYDGPFVIDEDGLKYTPSGRRIYDDGTVEVRRVSYDGPVVIGEDGLKYTPSGRRIYDDGTVEEYGPGEGPRKIPYDGPVVIGEDGLKYTPSGRRIHDDGTVDSRRISYDGPVVIGEDGLKYTPSGRRIYDDGTVEEYGPGEGPSRIPYDGPVVIGEDGLKYTPSGRRIHDDGTVDSRRISYDGPFVIGSDGLKYTPSGRRIYADGTVDEFGLKPKHDDSVGEYPGIDLCRVEKPDVLKGHKPSVVLEHSPDMVCCLSLKIWAVWLLEITHNAHNWTTWISAVIYQVREYASIIRGEVLLPNGQKKVLYKEDWRKFIAEIEEMTVSWRQYSKHVKDLTEKIVKNFHGKKVACCPKCLQDHLIKNVVTAHETLEALTEAMNCTGYWQRCLDEILQETMKLTNLDVDKLTSVADTDERASQMSDESDEYEIIEIYSSPNPPVCPGTCTPRSRTGQQSQPGRQQQQRDCRRNQQQQRGQYRRDWTTTDSDDSDDDLFDFEEINPKNPY